MKRDYFLTFLLCGGLLLSMLTGCKSSKKVGTVESASVKAHNEFFQSVEDQSFQFRTLTARLNVDLDIPGKQMSSRVDMKMVKDSAFQLSVQPFLGIEIFRIELSRDTIKVGFLRRDLPRLKRLDEVPAQVRSLVDGVAAGPQIQCRRSRRCSRRSVPAAFRPSCRDCRYSQSPLSALT